MDIPKWYNEKIIAPYKYGVYFRYYMNGRWTKPEEDVCFASWFVNDKHKSVEKVSMLVFDGWGGDDKTSMTRYIAAQARKMGFKFTICKAKVPQRKWRYSPEAVVDKAYWITMNTTVMSALAMYILGCFFRNIYENRINTKNFLTVMKNKPECHPLKAFLISHALNGSTPSHTAISRHPIFITNPSKLMSDILKQPPYKQVALHTYTGSVTDFLLGRANERYRRMENYSEEWFASFESKEAFDKYTKKWSDSW